MDGARAQRLSAGVAADARTEALRTGSAATVLAATESFARVGTAGKHRGNVSRDLSRVLRRHDLQVLQPYPVKCPIKNEAGHTVSGELPVFLLHEVLHQLHEETPDTFVERMGAASGTLTAYWEHHKRSAWFVAHPLRNEIKAASHRCIAGRIHGDDAPLTKTFVFLLQMYHQPQPGG